MEALLARSPATNPPKGTHAALAADRDRRGRLLHGYLHKTSNSLCGIKGYASLIADGKQPSAHTCRWARKIIAEVEQLEAVYRSVQDVAFPQQRQPSGSDLGIVVDRAVSRALRRHPQLCLERLDRQPGDLLLPSRDLELVLAEIFANCAEASDDVRPSARVRVCVGSRLNERGRLALTISDDGVGIAPNLCATAADPFVTTKEGHLGIGLARVDTVMDMYGLAWSLHSKFAGSTEVRLEVAVPRIGDDRTAAPGRDR